MLKNNIMKITSFQQFALCDIFRIHRACTQKATGQSQPKWKTGMEPRKPGQAAELNATHPQEEEALSQSSRMEEEEEDEDEGS